MQVNASRMDSRETADKAGELSDACWQVNQGRVRRSADPLRSLQWCWRQIKKALDEKVLKMKMK